jgi:hypothetical protein
VWVKDALINSIATKLNGAAYHVAVDTDAPKHLHLRWPGESIPITFVEQIIARIVSTIDAPVSVDFEGGLQRRQWCAGRQCGPPP